VSRPSPKAKTATNSQTGFAYTEEIAYTVNAGSIWPRWYVDENSLCIYSQLKSPPSSEVGSMIEGVIRHCTEMEVDSQYVDSHGQSTVAFAARPSSAFSGRPPRGRRVRSTGWDW
jgi:TnpA family transposase